MKVTIKDNLNIRIGKPDLNAPKPRFLVPGDVIEVEDRLYKGDPFEGSNYWFRDEANNFYWAGGVTRTIEKNLDVVINPTAYDFWHLQDLSIKSLHDKNLTGKGVKICMIDSGIVAKHTGIEYKNLVERSYIGKVTTNIDFQDDKGHGTQCASIVWGNGSKFIGIAHEASGHISRAYSSKAERDSDILYALENVPDDCKIVSVSYCLADTEVSVIKPYVKKLIDKNKIVVVAVGNNDQGVSNLSLIDEVISVGGVDQNGEYKNITAPGSHPTIMAPGNSLTTCLNTGFYAQNSKGTSFSTPIISALLALKIQQTPKLTLNEAKALLESSTRRTADGLFTIVDPSTIF